MDLRNFSKKARSFNLYKWCTNYTRYCMRLKGDKDGK